MRNAFKASRLIGLLALALGLMAFSATAAQAETGAHWDVAGTAITGEQEVEAENDSADSTLLTTVGKTPVEILCTTISFKGANLKTSGGATGKIHYVGCTTILNKNGVAVGNCKPHSPGATAGLIETNALTGLIVLHTLAGGAKDELLELKPTAGTSFVTIELGPLCAIGEKFDITGPAFIKDCKPGGNGGKEEAEKHLFEEGPLTALLFGTNSATIDGSAWGFLKGANATKLFSGHAA